MAELEARKLGRRPHSREVLLGDRDLRSDGCEHLLDVVLWELAVGGLGVDRGQTNLQVDEQGDSYREVYDDRKLRPESRPIYGAHNDGIEVEGKGRISKGRRHAMAMRALQKRFMVDIHKAWCAIECLPVAPEYSEAKLAMTHGSVEKCAAQ